MEDFENLDEEERLKAENDFLKMKLALERGMEINADEGIDLPPEVENEFLKHIQEFERQFDQQKTIKVFDKIGRPQHFKEVSNIPENEIENAYEELLHYLNDHGIGFDVLSPNISTQELYRFITEELFYEEIQDINIPGMLSSFIYDEFYPDPVYDNSKLAHDLLADIFNDRELFFEIHYCKDGFVFNGSPYNYQSFKSAIQAFKNAYDEIELDTFEISDCAVLDDHCKVDGFYKACAVMDRSENIYSGKFAINFVKSDLGYWDIKDLQIEGLNP